MTNRLYLPSLAIELDADYFEFENDFIYAPAKFNNPVLRFYIHEVLHFWQSLSLGFITNLALQEWLQLLDFEDKKTYSCIEERHKMLNSFQKDHPKLGFSAYNLSEALCRFWDVHIIGPLNLIKLQHEKLGYTLSAAEKLIDHPSMFTFIDGHKAYSSAAYDLLMQAEDYYAEPYRLALKKWGSKKSVIMFPLVTYFALQTPSPIEVFADAIEYLLDATSINDSAEKSIHKLWRSLIPQIQDVCNESSLRICGVNLTPGWDVIDRSELKDHQIYSHYLKIIKIFSNIWGSQITLYFALPGDSQCRLKLGSVFRPPVTSFYNGRWVGEIGNSMILEMVPTIKLTDTNTLANNADKITERYLEMCKAIKLL